MPWASKACSVRKHLAFHVEPTKSPGDDFVNRRVIVHAGHLANAKSAVARFERQPVDELDQAGHGLGSRQVGNVDSLDRPRLFRQLEDLLQPRESFFGVLVKNLGLLMLFEVAAVGDGFQHLDLIAEPGSLFESPRVGGRLHFSSHLSKQRLAVAVEELPQPSDIAAVLFARDAEVAGGSALANRGEQAGSEPTPSFIALLDVERARAELEHAL
jgi:hypothetical protein